ncbi:MAG: hypothetical protein IPG04_02400 [Polyangiaceae bacterium]|nr:hypothetical protein [Polyangiaceae bacterium]
MERVVEPEVEPEQFFAVARAKRRRRWRNALLGLGALGVVSTVLAAPRMILQADRSDAACSDRDYLVAPGDSRACAWRPHAWLFVPKLLPWTRTRALARERDVDHDQAERELRDAAAVTPNAAARDEAARRLLQASKGGPLTLERGTDGKIVTYDPAASLIAALIEHGAFAVAAEAHPWTQGPENLQYAYDAALAGGDLQSAAQIAARRDEPHWDRDLEAGAFLCLKGQQREGLEHLELAKGDAIVKVPSRTDAAQIAQVLCGADSAGYGGDSGRMALMAAKLSSSRFRGDVPLGQVPDIDLLGSSGLALFDTQRARTPFVAAWLTQESQPLDRVLDAVAPLTFQLGAPVSPYKLGLGAPRFSHLLHPILVDPGVHEKAAETLKALAATTLPPPPATPPSAPKRPAAKEGPAKKAPPQARPIGDFYHSGEEILAARQDPKGALERAAVVLWVEAASQRAALGRHEEARHDLDKALALDPSAGTRLFAASLAYAAGDVPNAEAHLRELAKTSPSPDIATLAGILDVLVAMRGGRWEDAHVLAQRTHAGATDDKKTATAWLLTATALRVGRPDEGPGLPTPEGYERDATTWEKLAVMPEAERRAYRLRMFSFSPSIGAELVLPAVFYVVGQAANGSDPEVWIDAFIPLAYSAYHTPTAARARAEAARWRGDEQAAKRHESRAGAAESLVDTPEKLVLASLAGVL